MVKQKRIINCIKCYDAMLSVIIKYVVQLDLNTQSKNDTDNSNKIIEVNTENFMTYLNMHIKKIK